LIVIFGYNIVVTSKEWKDLKMCFDYHYMARCNIARCVKNLKEYRKFKDDELIKNLIKLATIELRFFYKHRFDLQYCSNNGFGKYICNEELI